ncbi:MAG: signal peptidase II [Lachnospiraceae bacterium]|nr:signal peptidase II [Lachnospiraceae bacterium]
MRQWLKIITGLCTLIILDQITKLWAILQLRGNNPISIISGVLEFHYVENRGAAFGIMQNRQWFFLLITVVVLGILLWMMPRIPENRHYRGLKICLCLIAAGAVGNMIDRIFRKYVVDFIYFRLIDFPVFNVADIYVTVSAVLLIILVVFYYKDEDFEIIFSKRA